MIHMDIQDFLLIHILYIHVKYSLIFWRPLGDSNPCRRRERAVS